MVQLVPDKDLEAGRVVSTPRVSMGALAGRSEADVLLAPYEVMK